MSLAQSAFGKESSPHNGQKVNCGFIAPEKLASSRSELLVCEKDFINYLCLAQTKHKKI